MRGPLSGRKRGEARTEGKSNGVPPLIRRLIKQASKDVPITAPGSREADGQNTILDVEVDGVRCLLARARPKLACAPLVLSAREREVARMVAKGYPNKTIAAVLDISPWTVGTHLRRIFAKLGVGSRAAMVARLSEQGLIRGD